MKNLVKKAGLGIALAATALTAAAPAQAQRWHGGYHGGYYGHYHHGNAAGAALLGGIVGLGVGAAIASNDRGRYYDRGYYDRGYYAPPVAYNGYYDAPGYYAYRPRCFIEQRYDPYNGYPVNVRVCR